VGGLGKHRTKRVSPHISIKQCGAAGGPRRDLSGALMLAGAPEPILALAFLLGEWIFAPAAIAGVSQCDESTRSVTVQQ